MRPELKPFDVVVVDGLWYMPHHWLIRWRSLDKGVHCLTVIDEKGLCHSPEFTGLKVRHIDEYKGRRVTIRRYKGNVNELALTHWLVKTMQSLKGYDFRQWLFGFVLGITRKSWVDASDFWTCVEYPYWMYQENGYKVTAIDEVLPLPRLFRYTTEFETVFDGIWT